MLQSFSRNSIKQQKAHNEESINVNNVRMIMCLLKF